MNDAHHTTSAIASSAYHSTPSISHGGQAHAMIMTYIQPIYCPTGGCTHHTPLCLRLSTARLLHSYVCPCIYI